MLPIESYEFDLLDTVESVLEVLYTNARSKNLDLVCFVHPECPRTVIGDPARLRQVVMNLVSNAIKVLIPTFFIYSYSYTTIGINFYFKFTTIGSVSVHCVPEHFVPDKVTIKFEVLMLPLSLPFLRFILPLTTPLRSILIYLKVVDSGIGLKKEALERLFQRFYQVSLKSTFTLSRRCSKIQCRLTTRGTLEGQVLDWRSLKTWLR